MPDFEQATLMVDNCEPVLTALLAKIGQAVEAELDPTTAVQIYLTTNAVGEMRRAGDNEQATILREAMRGATPEFWREIGQHYKTTWDENQRKK